MSRCCLTAVARLITVFTPLFVPIACGLLVGATVGSGVCPAAEPAVRFNRDIRALLSDKCFACHGPDAETVEGGLRLDLREEATRSEGGAIVPGDPDASELVRRIFATDADERMPPASSQKSLTTAERELLRRWIAEGAPYEPHWAYTKLQRRAAPSRTGVHAAHPVDRFVAARLFDQGVTPVPKADRITLIRRLSFDLTGLPPSPTEVEAFINDSDDNAYEKVVDRLLNSPRYGERMAMYWLDLVRYADTVGYHGDQDVSQSPYRDYVINAFNANLPYDRFVREQLAGDLLPDPTLDQLVASGYNRLNQTTEEGGSQAKEYLAIYFADRVRNVSQVFMGATIGCAQCHDHKYDPYTAHDFYSLGAFFADLQESGVYSARSRPPMIRIPSEELSRQLAAVAQHGEQLRAQSDLLRQRLLAAQPAWETEARGRLQETREVETAWVDDQQDSGGRSVGDWQFVTVEQGPVHSGNKSRRQTSPALVQHFFQDAKTKVKVAAETRFYAWVYLDPDNPPQAIMLQLNDGSWEHRAVWGSDDIEYGRRADSWGGYRRQGDLPASGQWARLVVDPADVDLAPGSEVSGMAFTQFGGLAYWDAAGWIHSEGIPPQVADALRITADQRSAGQTDAVREYYLATAEPLQSLLKQIADNEAQYQRVEAAAPLTVVSKSVEPRTIRVLPRGNWMDDSGEVVQPAIPAFLGQLDTGPRRATRLDLANWLCQADNPLTSRTMVNRLWSLLFGRGICASVDDFGGQGTYPSYPDLLDWLAVEFVESGWDIKHILRVIVTSETYQRSSKPTAELRQSDPYNDLFARQGRFRVDAEMVRDSALAISGLLNEQVGGPSAKPYQPVGYYDQLNFPKRTYVADDGDGQYRRGLYTHWQRTFLHPMLKAFDAPSREECTARRSRSNTPLQALSLLNDPTFVEAARVYAARILREGGTTTEQRIEWAYQTALSRQPPIAVANELHQVYELNRQHYRDHVEEAKKLISEGLAPPADDLDAGELAAWTSVARVILNLHETIMRY